MQTHAVFLDILSDTGQAYEHDVTTEGENIYNWKEKYKDQGWF